MYVVREGWEGLVRGNETDPEEVAKRAEESGLKTPEVHSGAPLTSTPLPNRRRGEFVSTYGEGELLKEGEGEQTLRGRYIIRVSRLST